MAQIQYIKHLYEVEEKSLSEIARLTEKNFRTVQKYAYCDDWSQESLPDLEPKSYPVLGNYLFITDLKAYREGLRESVAQLTVELQDLRNTLKRAEHMTDESTKHDSSVQIKQVSASLRKVRQEVKLCNDIEASSTQISKRLIQDKENQMERYFTKTVSPIVETM